MHQDWVDQLTDDHPQLMEAIESARYAHSDGMGAYMCFMAVRLLAMHRVLRGTGGIYLHCDPTASHYLKAVMDAIFGWKNFENEIIWCYKLGGRPRNGWPRKHDIILFYRKGKTIVFNSDAIRVPYDSTGGYISSGRKIVKGKEYKVNPLGKVPEDWWQIPALNRQSKERTSWPTQKPSKLYERIIQASSNKGDIILDPFAGCATTLVAAERHDRQWIGIDIWEGAHDIVVNRMRDEVGIFGKVRYTKDLPERSDAGEVSAPFLRTKVSVKEPTGPHWTRRICMTIFSISMGRNVRVATAVSTMLAI